MLQLAPVSPISKKKKKKIFSDSILISKLLVSKQNNVRKYVTIKQSGSKRKMNVCQDRQSEKILKKLIFQNTTEQRE